MKAKIIIALFAFLSVSLYAQETLKGKVVELTEKGNERPLIGANVFWLGTTIGTTSDIDGLFEIINSKDSDQLVVSYVGYTSDTLQVSSKSFMIASLKNDSFETDEVEVVGKQKSTFIEYKGVENASIITKRELQKAACCDLSETFETNPSVDVSFTDAITGTKQIEMLGLSGIYTHKSMENLPYIRGLMSNKGLTFVPGTWIKAINVSKGMGPVVNGFESITGQIDISLTHPFDPDNKTMYLNVYANDFQRFEGNAALRHQFSPNLSFVTLLHASSHQYDHDLNGDRFLDMPKYNTFNIMQRWKYQNGEGFETQFGVQYVNEDKKGGTGSLANQATPNLTSSYIFGSDIEYLNLYGKAGYVFFDEKYKSFGFQWTLSSYKNNSQFGNKFYSGKQKNGYLNFIFQNSISGDEHKYRTGVSFLFDEYDETFLGNRYQRIEKVPGTFFEYNYTPTNEFSLVAGIRLDYHNGYGTMYSPRVHTRYAPNEDWVFRATIGKGYRSSNIFVEYASVFASSRDVEVATSNNYGYGLDQEEAWNFGLNMTHYFLYDWREATISIDLYRTQFESIVIPDLDSDVRKVSFSSVKNGAYSNSAQIELNIEPLERFTTRWAYRFLDVQNKIDGVWKEKALTAKHRAFMNLEYSTEESGKGVKMSYDLTLQWFGNKRIPSTSANPDGLRIGETAPDFFMMNAQVSRTFMAGFDFYVGVENLLDFRQENPIIDPQNPNGSYFDASLIWGPVIGRKIYAGMRYEM